MFNFLKKLMNPHVCEEFTRWQTFEAQCSRPTDFFDMITSSVDTVVFTRRWQSRQCTICGKEEQRELEF